VRISFVGSDFVLDDLSEPVEARVGDGGIITHFFILHLLIDIHYSPRLISF